MVRLEVPKRPPGRSTRDTSARFAGAVMTVTAENSPSLKGSSAALPEHQLSCPRGDPVR